MAGTPQKAAAYATLTANAQLVEDMLSDGAYQAEVARKLGVSADSFSRWARTPTGSAVITRARAAAAHVLAERTRRISDDLLEIPMLDPETGLPLLDANGRPRYREPTNNEIQARKLVADTNKWVASHWNRAAYGQQAVGLNVQVNLGVNALDALRKTQVIENAPAHEDVIDVEVRTLDDLL